MSVGSRQISTQRGHSLHGTRLGTHVALGSRARHASLQSAVHSCYGQAWHQMLANGLRMVGMVEQCDEHMRSDIVVERESAAISYQIVLGIQSQAQQQ